MHANEGDDRMSVKGWPDAWGADRPMRKCGGTLGKPGTIFIDIPNLAGVADCPGCDDCQPNDFDCPYCGTGCRDFQHLLALMHHFRRLAEKQSKRAAMAEMGPECEELDDHRYLRENWPTRPSISVYTSGSTTAATGTVKFKCMESSGVDTCALLIDHPGPHSWEVDGGGSGYSNLTTNEGESMETPQRDETHVEQHGDGDVNVEQPAPAETPTEAPAEAPAEDSDSE